MSRQNVYELILDTYSKNKDEGRILLYQSMGKLMRKNPLLKHNFVTFTRDDILSEAFMLADDIILNESIPTYKKISRLWYLFNKGGWQLHNKISQYAPESYNIDSAEEIIDVNDIASDDILSWILVKNNIITPLEAQVLQLMNEGHWRYDIARQLRTSYYNLRGIIELLSLKIERFIKENDINADNS